MKKLFHKELVITKKNDEGFRNSTKCWICDNHYVDADVKVTNHCNIFQKYKESAHSDIEIVILRLN